MPPGYNTQQKAAIVQFQNFTNADRNTAVKWLKNNGWNQDAAVNGKRAPTTRPMELEHVFRRERYFSGGGGNLASSGSRSNLNKIFDKYREDVAGSPDAVGTEGTMKYMGDIGANLEDLDALAVLEIVQAPAMGEMNREGFVDGWAALNCDSVEKQKSYINSLKNTLPSSKDGYTKVYTHTFQLAKTGNQKAIPLEMATAYWELLFTSPLSAVKWNTASSPWAEWWIEFLNNKYKRSVNKDVWNQTLKFAQQSLDDEAMSFWSEEASWPSVIDDFVEYVKKDKRGGGEVEAMEE